METRTFEMSNRTIKELHFNMDDLLDIKRAEAKKVKLENDGFNLKLEKALMFGKSMMVYVKFKYVV